MQKETIMELISLALTSDKKGETSTVPFNIGESYFIRTATYHCTGRVKAIVGKFIELEEAAWIPDSGRFQQAIDDGVLDEVEPIKVPMFVNTEGIIDFFYWKHALPRSQK